MHSRQATPKQHAIEYTIYSATIYASVSPFVNDFCSYMRREATRHIANLGYPKDHFRVPLVSRG